MSLEYCPNCGNQVDWQNNYCNNCGKRLSRESQSNQRSEQRQPNYPNQYNRQKAQQPPTDARGSRPRKRSRQQSNSGATRRSFILGGAGIVAIFGIGTGAYFWIQEGPTDVAEEFINAIDDGDMREANDLIHSQATFGGAGAAADALLGYIGGDLALNSVDISVENSEKVEENDGRAIVRLTLAIDAGFGSTQGDIQMNMRKEDGDWKVWSF